MSKQEKVIEQLIKGIPQAFLQQLFEGIERLSVDIATKRFMAMSSKLGEQIQFKQHVETANLNPERWLSSLETMMVLTLKERLFTCYEDMDLDISKIPEEKKEL